MTQQDDVPEEATGDSKPKLALMGDSVLTEADRRLIRKQQREFLKQLDESDNIEIDDAMARNNKIFESVLYTREAVLDGDNVNAIAGKAVRKVERLIQVPRYDADRLVHKLVQRIRSAAEATGRSSSQFDWEILGEAAGACFNAIPSNVCFLNGPLTDGQEPVSRRGQVRRRVVREDENVEEQRPEDVKGHTEKDDNKLSAIEKSMQDMAKVLRKRVDHNYRENKRKIKESFPDGKIPEPVLKKLKKQGAAIDGMQFLLNPKSFTQSVENIFHFSFLVKKGNASVSLRAKTLELDGVIGKPGLVVKYTKHGGNNGPPARQGIMALNMKNWRRLCEAYSVESGDLPHRKIHKQAHQESLSQA